MKRLFLTSSIGIPGIGESLRAKLGHDKLLKTVFITTPTEVEDMTDDGWYRADRAALKKNEFHFFDYTITGKSQAEIRADLANIDVIYISGGNTSYLLQESQKSGFVSLIQELTDKGVIYVGTSAGSIIAGPAIPKYLWQDERAAPHLTNYDCYSLVNFTLIPHWGDNNYFRDLYLGGRMAEIYSESLQPFVLCNDHEYIEVQDDQYRIIDVRREK